MEELFKGMNPKNQIEEYEWAERIKALYNKTKESLDPEFIVQLYKELVAYNKSSNDTIQKIYPNSIVSKNCYFEDGDLVLALSYDIMFFIEGAEDEVKQLLTERNRKWIDCSDYKYEDDWLEAVDEGVKIDLADFDTYDYMTDNLNRWEEAEL